MCDYFVKDACLEGPVSEEDAKVYSIDDSVAVKVSSGVILEPMAQKGPEVLAIDHTVAISIAFALCGVTICVGIAVNELD